MTGDGWRLVRGGCRGFDLDAPQLWFASPAYGAGRTTLSGSRHRITRGDSAVWTLDRHDRITYHASNSKGRGGTITKIKRGRWHAESDDTAETACCPTLRKAFLWVQHQAEIATR